MNAVESNTDRWPLLRLQAAGQPHIKGAEVHEHEQVRRGRAEVPHDRAHAAVEHRDAAQRLSDADGAPAGAVAQQVEAAGAHEPLTDTRQRHRRPRAQLHAEQRRVPVARGLTGDHEDARAAPCRLLSRAGGRDGPVDALNKLNELLNQLRQRSSARRAAVASVFSRAVDSGRPDAGPCILRPDTVALQADYIDTVQPADCPPSPRRRHIAGHGRATSMVMRR